MPGENSKITVTPLGDLALAEYELEQVMKKTIGGDTKCFCGVALDNVRYAMEAINKEEVERLKVVQEAEKKADRKAVWDEREDKWLKILGRVVTFVLMPLAIVLGISIVPLLIWAFAKMIMGG